MREAGIVGNLWRLLRPSPLWMTAAVLLGAVSSLSEGIGITLLIPVLNSAGQGTRSGGLPPVLQRLLPGENRGFLFYVLLIFGLIVCKNILSYSNRVLLHWVEGRTGHALRCRVFDRLMSAGCAYWDKRDPGTVLDTLANETWKASQSLQFVSSLLLSGCTIVVFTAFLFLLSWRLTSFVVVGLLAISALLRWASRAVGRTGQEAVEVNGRLGARMWDGVAGIRTIQAFSLQRMKENRFRETSEEVRASFLKLELLSGFVLPCSEILFVVLILGALAWQLPGTGSVSATLLFLILLVRLQASVATLQGCLVSLAGVAGPVGNLIELLDSAGRPELASGASACHTGKVDIVFDSVSFSYEGESRPALDHLNVSIPAGKLVAITGSSGAGKSTIAHLLCRFRDVTEGAIRIDGQHLTDLDLESWRSAIGLASQDTHLFSTTVRENIALGRYGVTGDEIVQAAIRASAHDFIQALPRQYDTPVGERGMRLSGGQRQRIALARALVRKPRLLILDEATNALDSETERSVMERLREGRRDSSVIVITHRPSSLIFADYAIVIEEGKVVEQGSPADLIDRRGRFYSLCHGFEAAGIHTRDVCHTL